MRTAFHVASVLVLLADSRTAIGTVLIAPVVASHVHDVRPGRRVLPPGSDTNDTLVSFESGINTCGNVGSEDRFVPRPLVQHPHALADRQPHPWPVLDGAFEDAARLVEAVAGQARTGTPTSTGPCPFLPRAAAASAADAPRDDPLATVCWATSRLNQPPNRRAASSPSNRAAFSRADMASLVQVKASTTRVSHRSRSRSKSAR
jgi:hypothetical protein